jgi:hypothetical protein
VPGTRITHASREAFPRKRDEELPAHDTQICRIECYLRRDKWWLSRESRPGKLRHSSVPDDATSRRVPPRRALPDARPPRPAGTWPLGRDLAAMADKAAANRLAAVSPSVARRLAVVCAAAALTAAVAACTSTSGPAIGKAVLGYADETGPGDAERAHRPDFPGARCVVPAEQPRVM